MHSYMVNIPREDLPQCFELTSEFQGKNVHLKFKENPYKSKCITVYSTYLF